MKRRRRSSTTALILWRQERKCFLGTILPPSPGRPPSSDRRLQFAGSVRYDGKSIQFVASDLIGKRTGTAFYWIVFFLLMLVVAAFGAIIGGMFVRTPEIASSYAWKILAALVLGVLMYRVKMNFVAVTIIGIVMLSLAIWLGTVTPIKASYGIWMWVFFFYIIIAAAIPM